MTTLLGIGVNILEGNDSLARLDIGHSGSDALDNTRAFMPQHDRKCAFGIFPAQCIGIRMTKAIVMYADADFVRFRRRNLNFLDAQVLASRPRHGSLASNRLATG